jgi:hypothetical protein
MVAQPRELVGTRLGDGGHGGRRRRAQAAAGGSAREARGRQLLYSRRARLAATGVRTVAPRGGARGRTTPVGPRVAARGVRRRGARGVLGVRAVMGKERPGRARPRAARARAPRQRRGRGAARRDSNVSDWQRLTEIFSKKLNRSAQSGK